MQAWTRYRSVCSIYCFIINRFIFVPTADVISLLVLPTFFLKRELFFTFHIPHYFSVWTVYNHFNLILIVLCLMGPRTLNIAQYHNHLQVKVGRRKGLSYFLCSRFVLYHSFIGCCSSVSFLHTCIQVRSVSWRAGRATATWWFSPATWP